MNEGVWIDLLKIATADVILAFAIYKRKEVFSGKKKFITIPVVAIIGFIGILGTILVGLSVLGDLL